MPDLFRYIKGQHDLEYDQDFIVLVNGEGIEIMLHATKEELAKFDHYNVHDGLIEIPNYINDDMIGDEPFYEELHKWEPTDMAVLRFLRANYKDCTIRFDGGSALKAENVAILHQAIREGINVEVVPKGITQVVKTLKKLAKEYNQKTQL